MIGVFDSGLGGLTVVKEIKKKYPKAKIIYLGDTARVPYGTRSKETVVRFALEDARFLLKKGVGCIVIACNTAGRKSWYPDWGDWDQGDNREWGLWSCGHCLPIISAVY